MPDLAHKAKHRQLWIDRVRDEVCAKLSLEDIEFGLKAQAMSELRGKGHIANIRAVRHMSQAEFRAECARFGLHGDLRAAAVRRMKEDGWPQAQPTVDCALSWAALSVLLKQSQIMMLDDRTAQAVVNSSNEAITAAELQFLPHNPCVVEFAKPIELCAKIKAGVRARAIGFCAGGDAEDRYAVAVWYLDYWVPLPLPMGARIPALWCCWFSRGIQRPTLDEAAAKSLGITVGSPLCEKISAACQVAARNLWDFLTMRSLRYDRIKRKAAVYPANRPQHTQGLFSQVDREVFRLYLDREIAMSEKSDGKPHPPQWGYRVEVPGKFHQWVYCATCGDVHRHDLLGEPCRKCQTVVGPRANVRVEKYWHPPYLVGPEHTPIKDVVRTVHRKKER